MVDRLGNIVRKGDCVRYWHKVNGKSIPEIGEITEVINNGHPMYCEAKIERKRYNDTNFSYRKAGGITKITKAEAVLWKMEEYIGNEGF
jgi:hypothetical protein